LDHAGWLFSGEGFLRGRNHWLEYDVAALVFLIVGMAAVGLLALMI
jgi:hypothetical protein